MSGTTLTFAPAPAASGSAVVSLTATDSAGATTTLPFTVTVEQVSDSPVADDIAATTDEDVAVAIGLSATDDDGDALTFALHDGFSTVDGPLATLGGGSVALVDDTATYTPATDYYGVDLFSYVANDGLQDSAVATVTVTIDAVNDAPTLDALDDVTLDEDSGETLVDLTNITAGGDDDEAGGEVDVTVTMDVAGVLHDPVVTGEGAARTLALQPMADANGVVAVTVTLDDGGDSIAPSVSVTSATFSVTVNAVNDVPLFDHVDDLFIVEDSDAVEIDVTGVTAGGGVDEAEQGVFLVAISDDPSALPDPLVSGSGATRTLALTPNADAVGSVTVTLTVTDDGGVDPSGEDTYSQDFLVTISGVNDVPLADSQSVSVDEDTPVTVVLTATDVDADALTYALLDGTSQVTTLTTANGATVSLTAETEAETYLEQWASTVIDFSSEWSSGSWAAAEALGEPDTFTYGDIATAWAAISLNGAIEYIALGYDTPVYADGAVIRETWGNGAVFQVDVLDTSAEWHTVWSGVDPTPTGSVQDFALAWARTSYAVTGIRVWVDGDHDQNAWEEIDAVQLLGSPDTPGSGTASALYTPAAEFTGADTFQFVVSDGVSVSDAATITVTVGAINDPPSFDTIDDVVVDEDAPEVVVSVTGITAGGDGTEATQTVTLTAATDDETVIGAATVAQDGETATITFIPIPDANGAATVTVAAADSGDGAAPNVNTYSAEFTLTVNPVNDPPTANAPTTVFAVTETDTVDIPLTGDDVDSDGITFSLWDGAAADTLTTVNGGAVALADATATYTPPEGYDGSDTFEFVAYDGVAYSAAATVTLAVGSLPRVSIDDVTVVEGDAEATAASFTISLTAAGDAQVTVNYGTAADTAVEGVDYTAKFDSVVFEPGAVSTMVSVTVHGDLTHELDDTFFVDLTAAEGAVLDDAQGVATITNDDAVPALTIADAEVAEGGTATLAVTMSNASDLPTTVAYATDGGTASAEGDYATASDILSIAPGEEVGTFEVAAAEDTVNEADETFTVLLTNPDGATIDRSAATVTIADDDDIVITVDDVSVTEDDPETPSAAFPVTLSGVSEQTITLEYATGDGEATAGLDYTEASDLLTIGPGATDGVIEIAVLSDDINEATETFTLELLSVDGRGVALAASSATGSIDDDDGLSIDAADAEVVEGDDEGATLVFSVSLSRASDEPVTVDYTLSEGSAASADLAVDIVGSVDGSVSFSPGDTAADIAFEVAGDDINEPDESVTLTLSEPTGPNATLAASTFTGVILDDDDIVVSVATSEAAESAGTLAIAITLSGESQQTVTVTYATADGSATAGVDYESATGDVTIEPGVSAASVIVTLIDDAVHEADETIAVSVTEPTARGVSAATTATHVTISNDDPVPVLSVGGTTVAEGDLAATFTVELSGATTADVTVGYATADATARAGDDYEPATGTLTMEAGVTSADIVVTLIDDATPEADEAFILSLTNATDATVDDGQAVATILDDDEPPTISILAPADGGSYAPATPSVDISVETAHHAGTWRWRLGAELDAADPFGGTLVAEGATATADGLIDGQAYRLYVALADAEGELLDPFVGASAVFGIGRDVHPDAREFVYDLPAGTSLFSLTLDPLFLTNGDETINVADAAGGPLASHLMRMGATVVTRAVDGAFAATIGRDGAIVFGPDFSLEAGSAYIVNTPEATSFTLEGLPLGAALTDDPLAAPDAQPGRPAPWVFAIGVEIAADTALPDDVRLRVRNIRTGVEAVATRVADGLYGVAFVADDRAGVAREDDILAVELATRGGYRLDARHTTQVTREDSAYASAVVRMDARPKTTGLLPNYPNPFNPETWIPFTLTEASEASVRVYDVHGALVRTLDLGHRAAGHYVARADAAHWDGRNAMGEAASSGVYFYEFVTGGVRSPMRQMVVRK